MTPQAFKLAPNGKRNGLEIAWKDLTNGDAGMAVALRASLNATTLKTRANATPENKNRPKQNRCTEPCANA